jgi:hypothetical protein
MTVDGTDFQIQEPIPFNRKWYSHKYKAAGVRYEVGVCIQTGDICWVNGPYMCGRWPDIKIFCARLMGMLPPGELVLTDNGYKGKPTKVRMKGQVVSLSDERASSKVTARHETVNRRFKVFGALKQVWCHDRSKHRTVFAAIVVIVQLAFELGEAPFQAHY